MSSTNNFNIWGELPTWLNELNRNKYNVYFYIVCLDGEYVFVVKKAKNPKSQIVKDVRKYEETFKVTAFQLLVTYEYDNKALAKATVDQLKVALRNHKITDTEIEHNMYELKETMDALMYDTMDVGSWIIFHNIYRHVGEEKEDLIEIINEYIDLEKENSKQSVEEAIESMEKVEEFVEKYISTYGEHEYEERKIVNDRLNDLIHNLRSAGRSVKDHPVDEKDTATKNTENTEEESVESEDIGVTHRGVYVGKDSKEDIKPQYDKYAHLDYMDNPAYSEEEN